MTRLRLFAFAQLVFFAAAIEAQTTTIAQRVQARVVYRSDLPLDAALRSSGEGELTVVVRSVNNPAKSPDFTLRFFEASAVTTDTGRNYRASNSTGDVARMRLRADTLSVEVTAIGYPRISVPLRIVAGCHTIVEAYMGEYVAGDRVMIIGEPPTPPPTPARATVTTCREHRQ